MFGVYNFLMSHSLMLINFTKTAFILFCIYLYKDTVKTVFSLLIYFKM